MKLTFVSGSQLASKYLKVHVVANFKMLVAIFFNKNKIFFYNEDTKMGHTQHARSPKSKMASGNNYY